MFRKKATDNFKKSKEYKAFRKIIDKMIEKGLVVYSVNKGYLWVGVPEASELSGISDNLVEVMRDEGVRIDKTGVFVEITLTK